MWKRKLCLGLIGGYGDVRLDAEEEIRLFAEAGFEGFFSGWGDLDNLKKCRRAAQETGLEYQSVHAPFMKARDLWHGSEEAAQAAADELIRCLEDCGRVNVPIMIAHTFIGFDDHEPNEQGLRWFEQVIRRAAEVGVKVAFENTEGMEYLDAVMRLAREYPDCTGFCWDTGHEMCYNWSKDMPGMYPGRLIATHINDNLGIRSYDGTITWLDDLHLLPFDGCGDWPDIARRLRDFDGPFTFELNTGSKPDRHDNDLYAKLTPREYLAAAYNRACRVAALAQRV